MPSPVRRRRHEATAPPRQPPALTDDILEEILLRIASPADLARASTACVSFRRLITDPIFLRIYRSRHPPLFLGFLNPVCVGFQPAEAPHPSAPVARSLAPAAADFSFHYLPPARWSPWDPCDVRDGRVLLKSSPLGYRGVVFPDLVVCDPLSRRHLLLPPIPRDLLASVQLQEWNLQSLEAFLVPSGEEEDATSFRVIGRTHCATKSAVFVFSSSSGMWSVGTSTRWDALSLGVLPGPGGGPILLCPCFAYRCFYWKVMRRNKLIKLDIDRMEFSAIDLSPHHDERDVVIVEAGEGRTGMFSHIKFGTSMYYAIQQNEGENANECQMENTIRLPVHYDFAMVGAAEGYIFLVGFPKDRTVDAAHFSLQIKTLKIEMVCRIISHSGYVHPYFGFPPSMSLRRI